MSFAAGESSYATWARARMSYERRGRELVCHTTWARARMHTSSRPRYDPYAPTSHTGESSYATWARARMRRGRELGGRELVCDV